MTAPEPAAPEPGRLDNGLRAPTYVPLTDVDPAVGRHLLTALGRARIAAYLGASPVEASDGGQRRLFVASEERVDARTIVAAAVRALGRDDDPVPEPPADPLADVDTDAVFQALVADWHVDTHAAIRNAERDLSQEDADWRARLAKPAAEDPIWLDDDHYIPPPPPPLPRLAAPTIFAMTVLAFSILILGMGGQFGLAGNLTLVLGVVGLLLGVGILFSRIHEHHRDEDDDGAAI
ncbi:MAG TPA: hypothetical protein VGN18_07025 [Jatrophihabitans sp.]|uniref:hypothetical protein n=1 Tax=Jatrophihabitans sp. TaxID=1932789 RepID=UPI002E00F77D|nr:hypothetical protein [Jatrophihabitans sp.]